MDEEARTAAVSFSSQTSVQDRWFGPPTVLLHETSAVNLSVMRSLGAALLNHDASIIVGRVDGMKVDEQDRMGRAVIHFDDDEDGNRAFKKVLSGSLRGVSVRFSVERSQVLEQRAEWKSPGGQTFKGGERGLEVATRWTPREISLTPIPADVSVGVGRDQQKEMPMFSEKTLERLKARGLDPEGFSSEEAAIAVLDALDKADAERSDPPAPAPDPAPAPSPDPAPADPDPAPTQGEGRAVWEKETSARLKAFDELARRCGKPEKAVEWFNAGKTVEEAQREVISILAASNPTPIGPPLDRGLDVVDKLRVSIEGAVFLRAGMRFEKPEGYREAIPAYMRFEDMARAWLRAHNASALNLTPEQAIERAFAMRAASHASGDFPLLLANVANKAMQRGFMEARVTYPVWTVPGTIPDFKQAKRPNLGEIQDFELTPDGMPFPESTISEKSESLTLQTYSRKFCIGRQALLNDDQRGLSEFPRRFGNAGNRTINVKVYAHLTSNSGVGPTMTEDTKALFATDHPSGVNYITGGGTTLQDSQVGVGRADMMKQLAITASQRPNDVTPSSAFLNIEPRFLLVPAALAHTADKIVNGSFVPTTEANARTTFVMSLEIVVDAQLDGATNGTTAWYLIADPAVIPTVEVARLAGQAGPAFRTWQLNDGLGFYWAGYVDFAVQALEHRGMFRAKGA